MHLIRFFGQALLTFTAIADLGLSAAAQPQVSNADIRRLQDSIYDASRDMSQVRSRDASFFSRLERELDDARDETAYLKVKLRKNEPIGRSEYSDLRDRIQSIRRRAWGDLPSRYTSAVPVGRGEDAGTELDVRLLNALSSATAQVEDHFEATTLGDLRNGNRVLKLEKSRRGRESAR